MMRVTQIFILLILLIFGSANAAEKIKHPGQDVSGSIKLNYMSKIELPPGLWKVAAIKKTMGGGKWVDVSLIQEVENKIKAWLTISYPTNTNGNGWYKGDNNVCDDYDGQQSNYHEKKIKTNAGYINSGHCSSVWVSNWLDESTWDYWDIAELTHDYIRENNFSYPSALVFLESAWYSKENLISIAYAYNPEFSMITTSPYKDFDKSQWFKHNIDSHPDKKSFVDKAISIQKKTIISSYKAFGKRKPIDLTLYDF